MAGGIIISLNLIYLPLFSLINVILASYDPMVLSVLGIDFCYLPSTKASTPSTVIHSKSLPCFLMTI